MAVIVVKVGEAAVVFAGPEQLQSQAEPGSVTNCSKFIRIIIHIILVRSLALTKH